MHRTLLLILTALAGVSLACSDRSPTSPDVEANTISAESAGTPALKTTGHTRHVVVVPPRPETFLQPGIWGSEKAGLTITKGSATLDILSLALPSGGCFGSYGEMTPPIPNGPFSIAGTYTQLIGAYPGKIQYAAQYSGAVEGHRMSIEVTVPALQQSFGPYLLTNGVNNAWSPCLYP
jgi:hypothetical protein